METHVSASPLAPQKMWEAPYVATVRSFAVQVCQIVVGHGGALTEMMVVIPHQKTRYQKLSPLKLHSDRLKDVSCSAASLELPNDAPRLCDLSSTVNPTDLS